jgi:hypothetical protein
MLPEGKWFEGRKLYNYQQKTFLYKYTWMVLNHFPTLCELYLYSFSGSKSDPVVPKTPIGISQQQNTIQ